MDVASLRDLPRPSVSICVPTYNRSDALARALDRLLSLDAPPGGYEIVVVDDGSADQTAVTGVLERAVARATIPVRWSLERANRGPGTARNVAWRMARGEWIAFTDDDCWPERDWLRKALDVAQREDADVVQGRTRPDPTRAHLLEQPWSRSVRVDTLNEFFQTCNIMYRRSILERCGGFDERLRLIGDDTDLGWRARDLGARVAFAEDAVVTHEVDVRDWLSDLRSRKRWIDVVTVMRRHPASRRLAWRPYVFRPAHLPILVLVAALPLTFTRHGRRAWVGLLAAQVAYDVIRAPSPEAAVVKLQHRVNDAWEVALLARKSVEERTLLL